MKKRTVGLFLLFVVTVASAPAAEPEPYTRDEFPEWALNVRRGEIIAFGALPVALLVSNLLYDLGRFVVKSVEAGEIDTQYAPWFFGPPNKPPLSSDEKKVVFSVGVSLSVGVAIADYLLGRRESVGESGRDR